MPTETQRTVLLIDDSAEDRAAYCRYLKRGSAHMYQVLEASSAAMGLDLYQRSLPDAILLDYSLPDMNGLEFLALMQQTDKQTDKQQVPVLMLTGQGNETIAAQAIKSGAQDYLIKGNLTADGLCKAIDQAIEQWQLQQRLKQQEEQQQMLSTIALQIRQSLTLQTILDTSVAAVRQYLSADRVLIYQFAPDMSGCILAEAVLPEWMVSLHVQIEDTCFRKNLGGDYRLGKIRAIADIYDAGLTDCHIRLLERFQVKANLVVPLLITDQDAVSASPSLWGLLVVHQCSTTRYWQPFEIDLLNQVAVQMAIAIQQAELYRQLQHELAERRNTEAALRKSEHRYTTLTEMSPVGIFQADAVGNCLYVNERWCQIAGLPPAKATGFGWVNGIHPADREVVSTEWYASAQADRPFYLEYRFQNAAGQITWVLGQAVVERGATGEIMGYVGTITDISDRKQAEASLQQLNQVLETRVQERTAKLQSSETRLREAQRIAHVGDWEFALASQTITWSEELFRLFGLNVNQGEPEYAEHLQSYVPESRLQLERAVQQATTLGTPYELELQFSRADGSVRWLLAHGEALRDVDGAIVKLLGTALDITERKQAEVALRESESRFAALAAAAPAAIFRFDAAVNCVYVNDRWSEMTGRPAAEGLGRSG